MTSSSNQLLVLASASPRRLALLRQIGVEPDLVIAADLDEAPYNRELPRAYAIRMAEDKARVVAERAPDTFVLAADTVVAIGRRILPKADEESQARQCLRQLSGRSHLVYGALALISPQRQLRRKVISTRVTFKRLSSDEIEAYIASREWQGKAGGYAIQGMAAAMIPKISGSYPNVVGLALLETMNLLHGCGWRSAGKGGKGRPPRQSH
ncbi:MAG: Maf family nucleotide pyrophosphatase [Kiloniellales bacterium]|nr:Maf family nucleotide pyrophosphatase [Kiloniellales bacterium]